MFRFTIRDVLWLTLTVALTVALTVEHYQRAAMQSDFHAREAQFQALMAETRFAELKAKELRGEVVLPASPDVLMRALERRGFERPRAIDAP